MEPLNNDKQEKIVERELKNFEKTFTLKQNRNKNPLMVKCISSNNRN